ncbi:hypothetical protein SteCoe_37564 [Stentor coeruleus]|uniref:Ubiquitin-like domain-containing protein n=1 Tax=Stentor coeruleus TaxID=5963 RepID=A0A1R2AMR7_9CILI|nr:hypothetical protein SteCoe_37564 [Stentor coeruleus]
MGLNSSTEEIPSLIQRIRPTPGSSGRKVRKGTVSIYCENTHNIYTINCTPGMTINEIKSLLPTKNCELFVSEYQIPNSISIESLSINQKTLIRMVVKDKISQKTSSTTDSLHEQETCKIIGPKRQIQDKPQKPNPESISSLEPSYSNVSFRNAINSSSPDDTPFSIDLKLFAVPDLKLENSSKRMRKSLY